MTQDSTIYSIAELEAQKTECAWAAMTNDVKFVLKRKINEVGALNAIKEVGRHFKGGCWSVTPFPDLAMFGELGLKPATEIVRRLKED